MNASEVITIGRSRNVQASSRGLDPVLPRLAPHLGELHLIKIAFLPREADQHHEPNLRKHVNVLVNDTRVPTIAESRQSGNDQDHRKRKGPKLYSAASTRKTDAATAKPNTIIAVLPA